VESLNGIEIVVSQHFNLQTLESTMQSHAMRGRNLVSGRSSLDLKFSTLSESPPEKGIHMVPPLV